MPSTTWDPRPSALLRLHPRTQDHLHQIADTVASATQPIGWVQVAKLTPSLPVFSPLNCPKKFAPTNWCPWQRNRAAASLGTSTPKSPSRDSANAKPVPTFPASAGPIPRSPTQPHAPTPKTSKTQDHPPKPLDSPGHSDQRATVVLFEAYEVLLHHFDLLGQFKERLENFALSRRRIQSRHQRMKASHGIAQLIAGSPHLSYRLGSFHALNGT